MEDGLSDTKLVTCWTVVANVAVNCNSNLHGKSDVRIQSRVYLYVGSRFALARKRTGVDGMRSFARGVCGDVRTHVARVRAYTLGYATYLRSNSQGAVPLSLPSYDLSSACTVHLSPFSRARTPAYLPCLPACLPNCAGVTFSTGRRIPAERYSLVSVH